ncbi:MAG: alpha/beta fold hydrolase [Myxococcota bacterium]
MLDTIEIGEGEINRSVIWLHGLGASGHDFEPLVPMLGIQNCRFVLPHAPEQPVTINMGMVMPAWYDIKTLSGPLREDLDDVRRNAKLIEELIEREMERGIPANRITLVGFSQGGAMALHVGLRYPVSLQGIMVLSAYLLDAEGTPKEATAANRETPVFFAHGEQDGVVPFTGGKLSYERTRDIAPERKIEFHAYPMGHEVCPEQIRDVAEWLKGLETAADG